MMDALTKTIRQQRVIYIAAMLILLGPTDARAGEITGVSWFSGVASVAGETVYPPTIPNNDNVTGPSDNLISVLQKDYFAIGPVDLVFDVIDSGGVTEYVVVEGVQNNTGIDWGSYHIELGFGNGVGFVKSASGDGLDFDAPDYDSTFDFNPLPGFFPTVNVTEDDIIATGGVMADLAYAGDFVFHVDVPDGITEFTIRQSPIAVPEPATVALLGLGGVTLLRRRKKA